MHPEKGRKPSLSPFVSYTSGRTRIQAERVPSFSGERWRKFCRGLQAERGEKMALVLVVGSTGQLGRAIVWRLRRDGVAVRAMVRPTSEVAMLEGSEAELIVGDLRDPESLRKACRGCQLRRQLQLGPPVRPAFQSRSKTPDTGLEHHRYQPFLHRVSHSYQPIPRGSIADRQQFNR